MSEQVDAEQPWAQLPHEKDNWYSRFLIFRDMGPVRSIRGAYMIECKRINKKASNYSPSSWREAAKAHSWHDRAKAWDAYRRTEVFNEGYAYDLKRIKDMSNLAQVMFGRIVQGFKNAKEPKGINYELIDLYLKTLEALALETGGRKKALELSGKVDSDINIAGRSVFVMPERGDLEDDIEQMTPSDAIVEGESGETS